MSSNYNMSPDYNMLRPIRQPSVPGSPGCRGFLDFRQPERPAQIPPPSPPNTPEYSASTSTSCAGTRGSLSSATSTTSQSLTWLSVDGYKKPFYQTASFEASRYAPRFLADAGPYDPQSPGYRYTHSDVWLNEIVNDLLSGFQFPLRSVPAAPANTPEPAQPAEPSPPSPLMAPPAPSKARPHKRQGRAAPARTPLAQSNEPDDEEGYGYQRALWSPPSPSPAHAGNGTAKGAGAV